MHTKEWRVHTKWYERYNTVRLLPYYDTLYAARSATMGPVGQAPSIPAAPSVVRSRIETVGGSELYDRRQHIQSAVILSHTT